MKQLVILGGGGHAKVVVDVIRRLGAFELAGYTDPVSGALGGTTHLGGDDILPRLRREGITHAFVALGDNMLRAERGEYLRRLGFALPALICPSAVVSASAQIGAGTLVMSGCIINADACIGNLAVINTRACIDHDCVVGVGTHVAPGAVLAGNVAVGELALIGAGAVVVAGMSIGPGAVVGAGAVVARPVPGHAVVGGVPARLLRRAHKRPAPAAGVLAVATHASPAA